MNTYVVFLKRPELYNGAITVKTSEIQYDEDYVEFLGNDGEIVAMFRTKEIIGVSKIQEENSYEDSEKKSN